jgi:hypothetical protein
VITGGKRFSERTVVRDPSPGGLPGARWRAVAADGLPGRAGDPAGAVGVGSEGPAELVHHDVVVPPAVVLEVGEAGEAAIGAVDTWWGSRPTAGWSQPPAK